MDIIGKWKYSEMAVPTEEGFVWMTIDECIAKNPDPMFEMMKYEVIEFTKDFKMITSVPKDKLPKEALEEFEDPDSGVSLEGENIVFDSVAWKEEGGKFYMHDDNPGEILGEKASEWIELPIEDGKINVLEMQGLERI